MEENTLFINDDFENFKKAVHLLYQAQDKDVKKKADKFLCNFDLRKEAWDISIQLLGTPSLEEEVYYNASQIIKKKLRFDFGNYIENKEIILNLSNFLVEKIEEFKNHKMYLLSNLCKCFSLLTIFSHHVYPELLKIVVNKFNNSDLKSMLALLFIFNYMAENENESDIVIDEDYRKSYINYLHSIGEDVLIYLDYLIKLITNTEYKQEIIRKDANMINLFRIMNKNIVECFKNWVEIGINALALSKLESNYISIIDFLFNIDLENMETYSECICMLLRLPLQGEQMGNLGLIILNKVIAFKDRVYEAIKIKDEDEIKFFIDIFIELSENYLQDVVKESNRDGNQGILNILVELSKNSPPEKYVCEFWYKFNITLYDIQTPYEKILEKYGNIFTDIIMAFIKLVKFEDNVFNQLNTSKTNSLKNDDAYTNTVKYRKTIKDFFKDMVNQLGFNFFYNNILFPAMSSTIAEIRKNVSNTTGWAILESLLFCFESICRSIDSKGDLSFIDTIFDTIFEIPDSFVQIKRTATNILDEVGNKLSLKPNVLMKAFNYLLAGIDNPLLIKYCSISLKNLLSDNRKILSENKQQLIKIYNEKVIGNALHNPVYRNILDGIMEVICYGDNNEEIKSGVVQILSAWVISLAQAKNKITEIGSLSKEESNTLIEILEIIKIIIRCGQENLKSTNLQIFIPIFEELWPILKFFLTHKKSDSEFIEILTQIIKNFMRAIKSEFKKYLQDYMNIILEGYRSDPISSYLYAFEVIATVFLDDPTVEPWLMIMFKELCLQTFNNYLTTTEDFESNPTLSEDFFGLLFRVIRLTPRVILDSELFENIFLVALQNIGISNPECANNLISFLSKVVTFSEIKKVEEMDQGLIMAYNEKIQNMMKKYGDAFVSKILNYLLTVPPNLIYENLKSLLLDLIQNYRTDSSVWFINGLKEIPSDCLTNTEKEKFIRTIQNYNENKMEDIIDNFYKRCLSRLYRQKKL